MVTNLMGFSQADIDALTLLEAMTESVLVTTAELNRPGPFIVYVNPAFEKMTGWTREEVLGRSPRILQGPETDRGVFKTLEEKLASGEVWSGQATNYRKDGSRFVMKWSVVPIRDDTGGVYRYLAVQRDVTERFLLERELASARTEERKWFRQLEETNSSLNRMNTQQQETSSLFAKYVPETIVKKSLAAQGGSLFHGEKLDIVALFCDMRGFTSISERLSPDMVVEMLNTYYSGMAKVIEAHEGMIAQFVGDEIFAVFGAPLPIRDKVDRALRCALAMVDGLEGINAKLGPLIGREIRVGIGLNQGSVIAGNLGSQDRISYSITGDTVNTAKRIESLAPSGKNTILVSESIYESARYLIETEPWPSMALKGKQTEVNVHEVLGFQES